MKARKTRAWLAALTMLVGAVPGAGAQGEMFRCQQADGRIVFQQAACPLSELVMSDPPPVAKAQPAARPAPAAASSAVPAPAAATVAPAPAAAASANAQVPRAATSPAANAAAQDEGPVRPSKRKRDLLELAAQFERCRADAPGFAEKSAPLYAAWRQRHATLLSEYEQQLAAKVRAGRRGETTLPLRACTDDWLRAVEPLTHVPDARYATAEKTWQVFMGALMTGDRATALACMEGRAATSWKQRTENFSDEDLRRIAATIRAMKVQWGDDYEKEGLVADTGNRVVGIAFRNINEEWKITELGGAATVPLPAQ